MLNTEAKIVEAVTNLFESNLNENILKIFENFEQEVLEDSLNALFDNKFEFNAGTTYPYNSKNLQKQKTIRDLVAGYAYDQFNIEFKKQTGQIYAKKLSFIFDGQKVDYTANAPTAGEEAGIGGWLGKVTQLSINDKGSTNYKQSKFWEDFAEIPLSDANYRNNSTDINSLLLFKKYAKQHKDKNLKDLIRAKQKIVQEGIKSSIANKTKNNKFFIGKKTNTKERLKRVLLRNYKELCVIDAMINLKGDALFPDNPEYEKITPKKTINFYKKNYYISELGVDVGNSKLGVDELDEAIYFQTVYYLSKNEVDIDDDKYLRIAAVNPKIVVSPKAPAVGGRGTRGPRHRSIPGVAAPAANAATIVRYNLAKPVKDSRTDKLQANILRLADGTDGTLADMFFGGENGFSREDLVDGKYGRITHRAVLSSLEQLSLEIYALIQNTEDDAPSAPPIVNEKRIIKLAKLLENKLLGESTNLLLEEEKVSKKELIEFYKKLKDLEIKFKRQGDGSFVNASLVDEYNSLLDNLVIKDRKIDYAASIKKIKAAEVKAVDDKTAVAAKGAVGAAGKKPLSVAPSQPYEVQCFNAKGTGSGESEMWEINEAWVRSTNGQMKFEAWYNLARKIFNHNPQDQSFDYKRGRKGKYEAYLSSIHTYHVAGDTLNVKCLPKFILPFCIQLINDWGRAEGMAAAFKRAKNKEGLDQLKQDAKFFYSNDGKFESTFAYKVYEIGMKVVSPKNIVYLTQRQEKAAKKDPTIPPPGKEAIKDARKGQQIAKKLDAKLADLERAENIGMSRKSVKMGKLNTRSLPKQTMFDNKKYKLFTGK